MSVKEKNVKRYAEFVSKYDNYKSSFFGFDRILYNSLIDSLFLIDGKLSGKSVNRDNCGLGTTRYYKARALLSLAGLWKRHMGIKEDVTLFTYKQIENRLIIAYRLAKSNPVLFIEKLPKSYQTKTKNSIK